MKKRKLELLNIFSFSLLLTLFQSISLRDKNKVEESKVIKMIGYAHIASFLFIYPLLFLSPKCSFIAHKSFSFTVSDNTSASISLETVSGDITLEKYIFGNFSIFQSPMLLSIA